MKIFWIKKKQNYKGESWFHTNDLLKNTEKATAMKEKEEDKKKKKKKKKKQEKMGWEEEEMMKRRRRKVHDMEIICY